VGLRLSQAAGSIEVFRTATPTVRPLATDELDLVTRLRDPVWLFPARYGTTGDFLMGVHRHLRSIMFGSPGEGRENIALVLDHTRVAAEWLGDLQVEAALNHGLFFMMRDGARKATGAFDGVAYIQRAILLHHQLGQTIQALGAQVDMTSLLITWGPIATIGVTGRRTPDELADWQRAAESYLGDAIARLAAFPNSMEALGYLGEAYHNRARLYERLERRREAEKDALACIALANRIGRRDLSVRGRRILGSVAAEPETAIEQGITAVQLLQDIRKDVELDQMAISWIGNKEIVFDASLHAILSSSRATLSETRACELLLTSLEIGRGLTYNRWVGQRPVDRLADLQEMLAADDRAPVLAVFAVAYDHVGLMILDGHWPPRLQRIAMTAADTRRLVSNHLRGLDFHRRLPGMTLWPGLQLDFASEGWRLVEPLEPYVAQRRPLCIVPHRALHSAAFHTLPTSRDGEPIGLRTPVFQNPNVTNWVAAKNADAASFVRRALVARTAPDGELEQFGEVRSVSARLADAGVPVTELPPERTSLDALASPENPWLVLHLGCHGIFRSSSLTETGGPDIGLLLARDDMLPPPFRLGGEIGDLQRSHLATPADLRSAAMGARLAFLASCLSARSEEYPGDDLMGVTRPLFASGTADLIAGAWTVVSSVASEFIGCFYDALTSKGARTADAMLAARKAIAMKYPDPFHWGVFMHMGANAPILETNNECRY
jgi:hypothetical protein